jgi:hypothetical protein
MAEKFNTDLLYKYTTDEVLLLNINSNIIVAVNDKYSQKLNAIIMNRDNNNIHVRYYGYDSTSINMKNNGLNNKKYNIQNYDWISEDMFIDDGTDDIISIDDVDIYKSYSEFPYFDCKVGNKFVYDYFKTKYEINNLQLEYYNTLESDTYNNLPAILENKVNIKNPVRIHNKYGTLLGCIIIGMPKYSNKIVTIDDDTNIEDEWMKYILLHMNVKFMKLIIEKYNISSDELTVFKNSLRSNISDNMILSIVLTEIMNINIKIYKYIDSDTLDIITINDKNLIVINIYNTGDIYEIIIPKRKYI